MNDLALHIFDTACAMNRAKLSEINNAILQKDLRGDDHPKGRWDTPSAMHASDCNVNQGFNKGEICCCHGDIAPHVVKIPLRAEVRDLLMAAKLYQEHADLLCNSAEAHEHYAKSNREQAAKLEQLARDARAQAENLERMANL